jgi:hypothetical protein
MSARHGLRTTVLAALVAAAFCGPARAADELEPNSTIAQAQELPVDAFGAVTITATVDGGQADVYSFYANAGTTVLIDIDGATADTMVSIHDGSTYAIVGFQDDATVVDEGSESPSDPYLQYVVQNSGKHYVVVTMFPDMMDGSGTFVPQGATGSGVYELSISGALPQVAETPPAEETPPTAETPPSEETPPTAETPPSEETPPTAETPPTGDVVNVAIDIRPGQWRFVRQNWKRRDLIPVAILSSPMFNPRDIDVQTLTFGNTGDEPSLRGCTRGFAHLNRDRRPDLVCFFRAELTGFQPTDEQGVLRGMTKSGVSFEGSSMLKVVPEKRHYGHRHGKGHHKDADNDRRKDNQRRTSWWSR